MTDKKDNRVSMWVGPGRFSFPYLATIDTGRQYSDSSFKTDFLITKADFKKYCDEFQKAILKVGREAFGDKFKLKGTEPHSPLKDTDGVNKDGKPNTTNEDMKGGILIRAKSSPKIENKVIVKAARQPSFIGAVKVGEEPNRHFETLTADQIKAIKGGDWGYIHVTIFPYTQKGGGVALALNSVQFWRSGKAFGGGAAAILDTAQELEIEREAPSAAPVASSSQEDSDDIF